MEARGLIASLKPLGVLSTQRVLRQHPGYPRIKTGAWVPGLRA